MAWLLTADMDTEGHGREGFLDGWHVVAFSRKPAALKAKAKIEALISEINAAVHDLQPYERGEAVVETPQWRELVASFPKAFGEYPTAYFNEHDFSTDRDFNVLLDVVPLEVRR
jgi:hypothetical protein